MCPRRGRRRWGRAPASFECYLREQALRCAWIDEGVTMKVRILRPPRPHILRIEAGDCLAWWTHGGRRYHTARVSHFAPTRGGGLTRGGVVTTI